MVFGELMGEIHAERISNRFAHQGRTAGSWPSIAGADQARRAFAWRPKSDRSDPIDLIEEAHSGRLERLIPVRVGRMAVSPTLSFEEGFVDGRGF